MNSDDPSRPHVPMTEAVELVELHPQPAAVVAGTVALDAIPDFLGSAFGEANAVNLLGQAGRQIVFIVVSVYGWYRWTRRSDSTAM